MSSERPVPRVAELEARIQLNRDTDSALERAARDRTTLDKTLASILPILVEATGAQGAWIRTFGESLELRDHYHPAPDSLGIEGWGDAESIASRVTQVEAGCFDLGPYRVVAQPLDVAGEWFGVAALLVSSKQATERGEEQLAALLDTWCEELDNYLAAIATARLKHRVTAALSKALSEPLLHVGIDAAIDVLRSHVAFEDLLLAFRYEDGGHESYLHYKIIQGGVETHDSRQPDVEVDEFLRRHAAGLLQGDSRLLLERFGVERSREEVLISGLRDQRVLGRLIIGTHRGEFATFDRDLLELFAEFLRRRIVDFNREYKALSHAFSPSHVRRLLDIEGYAELLLPRDAPMAILYADICGFTRLSEVVLREPSAIGRLINVWGQGVVEIVWDEGGVFDKMVGDCLIAFWGPPFDDLAAAEACRAALRAGQRIRDFTALLHEGTLLPELNTLTAPLQVSVGLNWTRGNVGIFGPDEEYTAFSSGMNSTARLQGLAGAGEILCMDSFVAALSEPALFGDERRAAVKNVRDDLRYRSLR